MGYRPELDGLRAIAVIAVVLFHYFGRFEGGFLGVDLFFLLSGFLITRLLLEEHHRAGRIGLARFYARRAARLLPALVVVAAASVLVSASGLGPSIGDVLKAIWLAFVYGLNWAHVFGVSLPLEHLWSLAVEEQFYVVWPLLLVALLAVGGMRLARWVAGGVIVVAVVQMAIRFHAGVDFDALYQGTDGQGAVFLMSGCLLGMLVATNPVDLARSAAGRLARLVVLPATLVLGVWVFTVPREAPFWYQGGFLLAVALDVCRRRHRAQRRRARPPSCASGRSSGSAGSRTPSTSGTFRCASGSAPRCPTSAGHRPRCWPVGSRWPAPC